MSEDIGDHVTSWLASTESKSVHYGVNLSMLNTITDPMSEDIGDMFLHGRRVRLVLHWSFILPLGTGEREVNKN